ncbi:rod shape-determining protein MreD [Betaproteobacteria bacterium]|nr:rod shape-determining protein MreD [Betaproteobacteria bacterium]GHU40964.1 rod shape-determining protein MreD [Betaproteobacteria bacterium]
MQASSNQSTRILQPARPWFILFSIAFALFLNLLPTRQWLFMPDWVMLTLCFWSVREWRLIGMGSAFVLGIFMDVANGAALGQHALAYVLLHYAAVTLSRRMLWFPLSQQALHVLPLFLAVTGIQILIRMLAGNPFPGGEQFISPVIAALLWLPITLILLAPQYRPDEHDDTRPI